MTDLQKLVKYGAIAIASLLALGIVCGCFMLIGVMVGITGGERGTVISSAGESSYGVMNDVKNLDILISAASLNIVQGERFYVESNLKNLKITETATTLKLYEKSKFSLGKTDYKDAVLTVYIPEGHVFDSAEITTGAGVVNIVGLTADTLEFELGTGDVSLNGLTVNSSADIEGGAGRLTVKNSSMRNLDLQMGVGQLVMQAYVQGRSKMEFGIGESDLTLLGGKSDYTLDIEKGIGSVTVDGKSVKDAGVGGGSNVVSIEGGIGRINVEFGK
ncbi:MAG: DUF4097 family beta strand repeat protein [Clostridia bacterium]|nr:DUF4097 family beta strand repeat protein [Clostridia bacterium]